MTHASAASALLPRLVDGDERVVAELAELLNWSASAAHAVGRIVVDQLVTGLALDEAVLSAALHPPLVTLAQRTLALLPLDRWVFGADVLAVAASVLGLHQNLTTRARGDGAELLTFNSAFFAAANALLAVRLVNRLAELVNLLRQFIVTSTLCVLDASTVLIFSSCRASATFSTVIRTVVRLFTGSHAQAIGVLERWRAQRSCCGHHWCCGFLLALGRSCSGWI